MAIRIHIYKPLELAKHQRSQYAASADAAADASAYASAYASADAAAADAYTAASAATYAAASADAAAAAASAYASADKKYNPAIYWEIRKKYLDNPNPCIQIKYMIRSNISGGKNA